MNGAVSPGRLRASTLQPAWFRTAPVALIAVWATAAPEPAPAQDTGVVAHPYYRVEHALQGLYRHHLPPLHLRLGQEAEQLAQRARSHCEGPPQPAALREAWAHTRLAWVAATHPALGPVVTRRSQREVDFWPVRPALLQRALASPPQGLADMVRVGGPAKGLPALEWLLAGPAAASHCPYLALVAEAISAEAQALASEFDALAVKDWSADEDAARAAFAEWINQWLGGLEALRWQQIEQPLQRARTTGAGRAPAFARQQLADNVADWRAQWQSLLAHARSPQPANAPPQPGQALVPIEALLRGKGHIALADRWARRLDDVTAGFAALPAEPGAGSLLQLATTMKQVTVLYQREVAAALDVPLGFSSADGD